MISIQLFADGSVMMKNTRKFYGGNYASFNKRFREMPPEERIRHHQKLVAGISQAALPQGFYKTDYETYPGIEEFSVTAENYAIRQGNYLYLDLPSLISALEGVNGDTRRNPLYLTQNKKALINLEVTLPEGVKAVSVMPPEKVVMPVTHSGEIVLETELEYDEEGRQTMLKIREHMDLNPAVIMPEEYPQLLETQRVLSHPSSQMILLELE